MTLSLIKIDRCFRKEFTECHKYAPVIKGDILMRRLGLGDIRRADDLVGKHQIHHADSRRLGLSPQRSNLRGGYEAKVHQHVHQIIVSFSHGLVLHHTIIVKWSKHQINDRDNNVNEE